MEKQLVVINENDYWEVKIGNNSGNKSSIISYKMPQRVLDESVALSYQRVVSVDVHQIVRYVLPIVLNSGDLDRSF